MIYYWMSNQKLSKNIKYLISFNLTIHLKHILFANHLKQAQSIYIIKYFPSVYIPTFDWAIRKTNSDGSLAWVAALSFEPILDSLSVDTLEQIVYVAGLTNPLDVVRLRADTGSIVDAQR